MVASSDKRRRECSPDQEELAHLSFILGHGTVLVLIELEETLDFGVSDETVFVGVKVVESFFRLQFVFLDVFVDSGFL